MLRFAEVELSLPTLTNRDKGANDKVDLGSVFLAF